MTDFPNRFAHEVPISSGSFFLLFFFIKVFCFSFVFDRFDVDGNQKKKERERDFFSVVDSLSLSLSLWLSVYLCECCWNGEIHRRTPFWVASSSLSTTTTTTTTTMGRTGEIEDRLHNLESQMADQFNVIKTMLLNIEDKLSHQETQYRRANRKLHGVVAELTESVQVCAGQAVFDANKDLSTGNNHPLVLASLKDRL